jgi:hypothetical protein
VVFVKGSEYAGLLLLFVYIGISVGDIIIKRVLGF